MTPEAINIACAERVGHPLPRDFTWKFNYRTECDCRRSPHYRTQDEAEDAAEKFRAEGFEVAGVMGSFVGPHEIPDFHGSMDAALQLVEKANSDGWAFELSKGCRSFGSESWIAIFENQDAAREAHSTESPSAAICEAFLKLPQ